MSAAEFGDHQPVTQRLDNAPEPESSWSLLDDVLAMEPAAGADSAVTRAPTMLERLMRADSFAESLRLYAEASGKDLARTSLRQLARAINRDVAKIDRLLNGQVNAILHHPRFQKLEGSWRGLQFLASQVSDSAAVKIRVLDVSWKELVRDIDRSIEFDQNRLFKKIYSDEFGTPGGTPYSVLLGDYEIRPRPRPGQPMDDLDALQSISQVAAAAFSPFIASAHPSLLGLDSFTELQRPMDLEAIIDQPEFVKWRRLRREADSRFVGLVLPRVLMRRPYTQAAEPHGFVFREEVDTGGAPKNYLWGNAVYAFGAVLIRAFTQSGWLADIRGVRQDLDEGGIVTGLPTHSFGTDRAGVVTKTSTEVAITDEQENDLAELGMMPLCDCRDTEYSAFYSNPSVQKPELYDDPDVTKNAKISSMLHYMLCVSRIAHYIKVIGREKVGSFMEAGDCEAFLNDWIQKYVTQDDDASPEVKARYPLREAHVEVREHPGKPGTYACVVRMQPHYQLDDMSTSINLTTELAPAS
ncbi:MAG: type VI secretion system contractile sheath large subunit [Planctomycetales bacterium]|nr:type VI secretion system contractile sheath large subunit [Planctomycetales bacterium]